ncbi:hypothetical protein EVAR_11331_1 [Eumeta japonica]|uniref:Uncharacterized protein n=1 Tax=Eumeta variegata TaxID=151549 RepID=A0A4C1U0S7_EUMVA|nr:hypothetical protein EVAR_11331_1 [Eumeta japonica]
MERPGTTMAGRVRERSSGGGRLIPPPPPAVSAAAAAAAADALHKHKPQFFQDLKIEIANNFQNYQQLTPVGRQPASATYVYRSYLPLNVTSSLLADVAANNGTDTFAFYPVFPLEKVNKGAYVYVQTELHRPRLPKGFALGRFRANVPARSVVSAPATKAFAGKNTAPAAPVNSFKSPRHARLMSPASRIGFIYAFFLISFSEGKNRSSYPFTDLL